MSTVDTTPLSDSQLDALALWVDARYVKGFQVREDNGVVRPLKNIEMMATHRLATKRRIEALAMIERRGCCMQFCEQYTVDVWGTDHNESPIQPRQVVYCGRTNEPCPRAQIQNLIELFSILNSEHIVEYRLGIDSSHINSDHR